MRVIGSWFAFWAALLFCASGQVFAASVNFDLEDGAGGGGGGSGSGSGGNEPRKLCSDVLEDKFRFGLRLRSDTEKLINFGFAGKQPCEDLVDYLVRALATYVDIGAWDVDFDEYGRRQLVNKLLPLLHYRASMPRHLRSSSENISSADRAVEAVLSSKLLVRDSSLFEEPEDSKAPCTERIQNALQVAEPFEPKLAVYLARISRSQCRGFLGKLKATAAELTGSHRDQDWAALPNDTKRRLAGNVFAMMHIQSIKPSSQDADSKEQQEPGWKVISKNNLFLGDIFVPAGSKDASALISGGSSAAPIGTGNGDATAAASTANASETSATPTTVGGSSTGDQIWRTLLWVVLFITAGIAAYLALSYLNIVPSMA